MIQISESAIQRLKNLKSEEGRAAQDFLRVEVKKGGCSGLSYKMDFDSQLKDGDKTFESHGEKVVVDSTTPMPVKTAAVVQALTFKNQFPLIECADILSH